MQRLITRLLMVGAVLVLAACGDGDKSGPEDIHWDRDVCELCKMFVSDPRFAAEVRGGEKNKLYKFDDIGCAINWLNDQHWAGDQATEIWVAEGSSTREKMVWLNAREAHYVRGELTPMNYGYTAFAPTSAGDPVGIDFVALTSKILADAPNHICKVPDRNE
ncbi:nitrous oxide reductase accessory protein NosL [Magnetovibrio sp.]|uniref:nitrous oxide reductase accessory protein NosL n=1 Tax=Magnetovibrio sp. TaxID=2024836 RepID=UPI002F94F996